MGNKSSSVQQPLDSFSHWNDLPPELKSACIKHLDFKTRLLLRSTSRAERALVDSQKFNLEHVQIKGLLPYPVNALIPTGFDGQKLTIVPSSDAKTAIVIRIRNLTRFFETVLPLLVFILTRSVINEFSVEGVVLKNPELLFFVSRLGPITKSIYMDGNTCNKFPIEDLINNDIVTNARMVRIRDLTCKDAVWKLAEKWIENDSVIGTTFQVTSVHGHSIPHFVQKFRDRIIFENHEEVRITTNNPSKHILLKLARRWRVSRPLTCVVISSYMKKEEYESFGHWVSKKVMPIWEYLSFVFTDDFHEDDGLNCYSFIILIFHCLWLIITLNKTLKVNKFIIFLEAFSEQIPEVNKKDDAASDDRNTLLE
ncbi:Protein CBR-FBXA-145 [Caenorhabditis briggsae]|uniref:Protein CBR-FBXA-145 n=1 Tax=Caenorhabditis briggsae TaxID=6238 RepID=A8XFK9_CAEBR|nr:Protein CBR-FBXA-145 [Caenorhabditis briggsae]CAP31326.1 Protein CBR-FBXA-145 [Caenorhabditis briggsae]